MKQRCNNTIFWKLPACRVHLAPRCTVAAARSGRCRCASWGRCWWCYRPLPNPAAAAGRLSSTSCRRRQRRGASPASLVRRGTGRSVSSSPGSDPVKTPSSSPLTPLSYGRFATEASEDISRSRRQPPQTSSGIEREPVSARWTEDPRILQRHIRRKKIKIIKYIWGW